MSNVREDLLSLAQQLPIRTVYDCGSRDAKDGIALAEALGAAELHVFECNPDGINCCRTTIGAYRGTTRIHLNETALCEREGEVEFFAIDPAQTRTDWKDGNIGASSLYRASTAYPYERYVQKPIRVPATTLDRYCRTHAAPDLLWMDLQGAELRVLSAAREILSNVKLLHLEVMFRPMYRGQALFWDVHRFLRKQFALLRLYDIRSRLLLRLNSWLDREKWFTNAVYVSRGYLERGRIHAPRAVTVV